MTNRCMCKRGFFALRDCDLPAVKQCERCARPTCQTHLSPHSGMRFCVECAARDEELQRQAQADNTYDADWTYGYRHRYYTDSHYQPLFWGPITDSYYDDYDFRSFDREVAEPVEGDFGGGGAGGDFLGS